MRIIKELERFESLVGQFEREQVQRLGEYVVCIKPPVSKQRHGHDLKTDKIYAAAIMALTHGNEFAGVAVVNQLLALLLDGVVTLAYPFVFSLNNVKAAIQDKRFIDEDLNRCFGSKSKSSESWEACRSSLIEGFLQQSEYCLDIHQTQLPMAEEMSFWPALDVNRYVEAVKEIDSEANLVATPAKLPEDLERGVSCDNFMNLNGSLGVTIELGQRGFDSYQISKGVDIGLRFIQFVHKKLSNKPCEKEAFWGREYKFIGIVEAHKGVRLRQDLRSFTKLSKGELVAYNADDSELCVSEDCRVLFPKVKGKLQVSSKDPLCYLVKAHS